MFQPLDGPALQGKLASVGTITPIEVKVGANALTDRQVITLQPTGNMKVYFAADGAAPSAATVSSNGFTQYKDTIHSYEAGEKQRMYVLAVTGTIDVIVAERA